MKIKDTEDLSDTINQPDPPDIYKTQQLTAAGHLQNTCAFWGVYETFTKTLWWAIRQVSVTLKELKWYKICFLAKGN